MYVNQLGLADNGLIVVSKFTRYENALQLISNYNSINCVRSFFLDPLSFLLTSSYAIALIESNFTRQLLNLIKNFNAITDLLLPQICLESK